jgi:hypothetical protein
MYYTMENKVDKKNFQELTDDDHSDTLPPFINPIKYITWVGIPKSESQTKSKWNNYTNVDDWDDILNMDVNAELNMELNAELNMELNIDKENPLMS